MAQLVVRKIEDDVKERLRERARARGRSMEDEARDILRNALLAERPAKDGAGTQLASLFAELGIDFEIPEMHGEEAEPVRFRK